MTIASALSCSGAVKSIQLTDSLARSMHSEQGRLLMQGKAAINDVERPLKILSLPFEGGRAYFSGRLPGGGLRYSALIWIARIWFSRRYEQLRVHSLRTQLPLLDSGLITSASRNFFQNGDCIRMAFAASAGGFSASHPAR